MSDDIAAWLTAIWDEDEAAAEGNGTIAWLTFRDADGSMRYTAVASGEPDDHWVIDGDERTDYAAVNVVHDWRAVLARIAVDRQILAIHTGSHECPSADDACGYWQPGTKWHDGEEWVINPECPTVRLLALPHADRPGYQESWRPAPLP